MAEPNNTPQAESPVQETTPLLAAPAPQENIENSDTTTEPRAPGIIRISTFVSLVGSLVGFGVLIAAWVVSLGVNRYSYVFSTLNDAIWGMEWTLLIAILFDSINIHKLRTTSNARTFFPLIIQIPVDLLLTVFILNFAGQAVDIIFSDMTCSDYGSGPACKRWILALRILLSCGLGAAAAASLAHLSLLIIRTVAFFQGRLWTGAPWMIPAGQLNLEFNIRFLRQE